MIPVFSKVRVDITEEFVGRFPEHLEFVGLLHRVSEDFGVRVTRKAGQYRLQGQWSPMGKVHDMLVSTLVVYGASGTLQVEKPASRAVDTPTDYGDVSSAVGRQSQPHRDEVVKDTDDDCDDENHEYNTLKNTISDICSALGNEDDLPSVSHDNDELGSETSSGSEDKDPESCDEKSNTNDCESVQAKTVVSNTQKSFSKKKKLEKRLNHNILSKKVTGPKMVDARNIPSGAKCYTTVTENCERQASRREIKDINCDNQKRHVKIYQCVECDFTNNSNTAVREHFSRIHRANPTKCSVCNKLFPSERYAKRHCRLVHRDTQFCCEVCGKTYKMQRTLEEHMKSHNEGYIKPDFPCEMCDKSFSSNYVLKCHLKSIHYGENHTYLCPICGKSFTTKHSLNMHQNVHSGSRPFTCNVCGKSFMYDSALRDHKFIHSGDKKFECEICHKGFQQRSGLQVHVKIHQEKKAYECSDCGRAFIQKQSLQRHERSHKGEKPFLCKICGRFFGDSGIIRRHLIMVHKIQKDAKSWREDIVEKGRGGHFDEGHANQENEQERQCEDVPSQNIGESYVKETKQDELQNPDMMKHCDVGASNAKDHSDIHQMKYQEGCDSQILPHPSISHTVSTLVNSPAHQSSPVPTLVGTAAVGSNTYLPPANTFLANDYCRPLALPSQLSVLGGHQGGEATPYDLNSHQQSPYVNTLTPSHLDSSRYHYPGQTSAPLAVTMVTSPVIPDGRYTSTPTDTSGSSLPRVDSVLNKRLHDMEPPENLSISSLYAYYTNLASQYLNASQYSGYGSPETINPDQE